MRRGERGPTNEGAKEGTPLYKDAILPLFARLAPSVKMIADKHRHAANKHWRRAY